MFWANFLLSSSCDNFTQDKNFKKQNSSYNYQFCSKKRKKCQNCQNYCIFELGGQPIRRRQNELLNADWLRARSSSPNDLRVRLHTIYHGMFFSVVFKNHQDDQVPILRVVLSHST